MKRITQIIGLVLVMKILQYFTNTLDSNVINYTIGIVVGMFIAYE